MIDSDIEEHMTVGIQLEKQFTNWEAETVLHVAHANSLTATERNCKSQQQQKQ